jgi:hypothetical protein
MLAHLATRLGRLLRRLCRSRQHRRSGTDHEQGPGFSAFTYGLGAGIFFLGYVMFEVPSNLVLERVGARRWIARIMFT